MKRRLLGITFYLYAAFCIWLLTGCATQSVEQTAADGTQTKYSAKQLLSRTAMTGTVLARKTKTTEELFGQKNSASETQTDAIKAMFDGMQNLFEAGAKVGAKTVVPIP